MHAQAHTHTALLLLVAYISAALASHYETLGVSSTATAAEIKKRYRKLALKHHPDKAAAGDKEAAEKRFAKIGEAYETLKDEKSRAEYDESLRSPRQSPGASAQWGRQGARNTQFFYTSGTSGGDGFQFRGGAPDLSDLAQSLFGQAHRSSSWGGMPGGWGGAGASRAAALYPKSLLLSSKNLRPVTRAARGDDVWLIHFFTSSSHGCKQVASRMQELSSQLQGIIRVGAVDCDAEQELCERQAVRQFPLVKLLSPEPGVKQFTKGAELKKESLRSAALDVLPSYVLDVRKPAHKTQFFDLCARKTTSRGCVLLYTDKYETPVLLKRLSAVFKNSITFGVVRGAHNSQLGSAENVSKYPTLQYFQKGGQLPVEYEGKIKYDNLYRFLKETSSRSSQ
jgi:thiol-disulfide isomerase/thioredoxin